MTFPSLQLPRPAFDAVYKCLDVAEIISLSQCSRTMCRIVSSQETPRYGRQIKVTVNRTSCRVAVGKPDAGAHGEFKGFTWDLCSIRDYQLADVREFIDRKIDGVIWKVGRIRKGWVSVPDQGCMERDLLTLLNMFKSIFHCPIYQISLDFGEHDFGKLLREIDALHIAENITVMSTRLDHDEADFLFDKLITDNLVFGGYAGKEYVYQKPLNFPRIKMYCAAWINYEKLMEMVITCKSVDLESAKQISDKEFNQFIKNWMGSDQKTLETVKIVRNQHHSMRNSRQNDPVAKFQRPVIMEGIEASQRCKKRPDAAEYYKDQFMYQNGLDIRRQDGVWATVLVGEEYYQDAFIFTVWYDENPHLMEEAVDNG